MAINNEFQKELWLKTLEKYRVIKEIYIESEENDPELDTNIQPLNEFRAALDHVMKMMAACYELEDEAEYISQMNKLDSHLSRAFYDISDMACIHYRNKIVTILSSYEESTIRLIIPTYYTSMKVEIERISQRIASYRYQKGGAGVDTIERFQEYKNDFYTIKQIYLSVIDAVGNLEQVESVLKKREELLSLIDKYSDNVLTSVLPQYHSEWYSNIKTLDRAEGELDIYEYITNIYNEYVRKEPLLKALSKKEKRNAGKNWALSFFIGFITGFLSSLVASMTSIFHKGD